jgi:hypothetical protein
MREGLIQIVVLCALIFSSCARQGEEVSRWETADSAIHVRIIELVEVGGFPNGAYYVFESRSPTDKDWHHVMTFRHDDQVRIPTESVIIKSTSLAYVSMGWMFAVTTDSGRTWSVWNAESNLPGWTCCNYGLIRSVDLDSGGSGTMTLNPIRGRTGEVPRLYTNDYGRTWTPSGG